MPTTINGGRSAACSTTRSPASFLLLLLGCWMLFACAPKTLQTAPTLIPVASAPELPRSSTLVSPSGLAALEMVNTTPDVDATASAVAQVPTPKGTGVSPVQAIQQFVPDAGPVAPADWRPPPYGVPLSLHPDDHYWLSRPIPSNRRNYDLEWYPFGNDVLIPERAPYRIHHGIDLPNDQGTPVLAAGSGTVIHAGPLPSPRDGVNYYGNTVVILHDWQWQGQDVYTLYAHTLELFVKVGDVVEQGEVIAGVGSSGEVTSSHLHFEVRVGANNYDAARNPALWLAPYEGWGTVAGRFVDSRGRKIPGATVSLIPVNVDTPARVQRTYSPAVRSDEVWQENYVVGDLPAGRYTLFIQLNNITYRRDIEVFPGRTTFDIISTRFEYIPTATPIPIETPTAAAPSPESFETTTATPTPES